MQQITLAEASLQAQQVEVISRMIERNHEEIDDHDLSVIAGLIKQLSSNVAVWLMTEEEKRRRTITAKNKREIRIKTTPSGD